MAEINLLPDELREKEQRELKSVHRKPKVIKIGMSSPEIERVEQSLKTSRPSLLSRLFAKKVKPGQPISSAPETESPRVITPAARETTKIFHIPKAKAAWPRFGAGSGDSNVSIGQSQEAKALPLAGQPETKDSKPLKISPRPEKIVADISPAPKKLERKKFSFAGWFSIFNRRGHAGSDQKALAKKSQREEFFAKEKKSERGTVLDVNLIPAELAKHPELELPRKLFLSGSLIFIFIILIAGGYLGITWYQIKITREIKALSTEIMDLDQEIKNQEETKSAAIDLQQRLKLVEQLLNGHVYWTKFFDLLEQSTIDEVYYTNFSMAGREKLVIAAVGKDYNSVAKQLVSFEQATDFVKTVRIDAASAKIDDKTGTYAGVSFNINLEFLPEVFVQDIE